MKKFISAVKSAVLRKVAPVASLAMLAGPAFADGVDTSTSSLGRANSWLMTWIPTACVIGLIVSALAWMFHMLRLDWAVRLCVGMIVIGSASYIVGWFFG